MKITTYWLKLQKSVLTIALLLACGYVHAQDTTQWVTIPFGELSRGMLIGTIQRQTGFRVAYTNEMYDTTQIVRFPRNEVTIRQALDKMVEDTDLRYLIRGKHIALVPHPQPESKPKPKPAVAPRTGDRYVPGNPNRAAGTWSERPKPEPEIIPEPQPEPVAVKESPAPYSAYTDPDLYAPMRNKLPRLAVKTNVLYGAATLTLNLAFEIGLNSRSTVEVSGDWNQWTRIGTPEDNKKLNHWIVRPEFRYWLCERFNGHFFGVHAFYSQYNISNHDVLWIFDRENRYEGHAYGAGFTYGYHLALTRRWGVEFPAGVQANMVQKSCTLLRSWARVDVGLDYEGDDPDDRPQGLADFKLKDVRLFRAPQKGELVPLTSNWTTAGSGESKQITGVSAPSIPSPAPAVVNYTDASYNAASGESTDDVGIKRELYMFEVAGAGLDHSTAPCLVIGGLWGDDTDYSYYKVYFGGGKTSGPNGDPETDILRNRNYRFNIASVKGRGYPTVENALTHESSDLIVLEVIDWNADDLDTGLSGQYYLRVVGDLDFNRSGGGKVLEIETNDPTDVVIEASAGAALWIEDITPDRSDVKKQKFYVTVKAKQLPDADTQGHDDYVIVKTDHIERKVRCTQSTDIGELRLQISVNELHFGTNGRLPWHLDNTESNPAPLEITWEPANAHVAMYRLEPGGAGTGIDIDAGGSSGNPFASIPAGSGSAGFQLAAKPYPVASDPAPLRERSDIWMVTATHPTTGETMTRMVSVKQFDYGVAADPGTYILNGQTYDLNVRSNANWRIREITETNSPSYTGIGTILNIQDSDNLKVGTTGGYNTAVGDAVNFTVVNASDDISGTIAVVFESVDGVFADQTLILTLTPDNSIALRFARSNIVWIPDSELTSGGILTFAVTPTDNTTNRTIIVENDPGGSHDVSVRDIPANVQGAFFRWGSLVAVSPVGNYSTNSILFNPTTTSAYTSYGEIPYVKESTSPPFDNDADTEDDFATYNNSKGYDASAGKGDICRYISKMGWVKGNWRLPTGAEIGELVDEATSVSNGGVFGNIIVPDNPSNASGFYQPVSGRWLGRTPSSSDSETNPASGVYFPTSGLRSAIGSVASTGYTGYFWSGSSYSTANGYSLYLYSGSARQSYGNREGGFPVRCVRDL